MADRVLITGGSVVTLDPTIGDLREGSVLFEGEEILEVAASISAEAEVVDASEMIVMPGLVDPHRHLWQTGTRADMLDGILADLIDKQWPSVAAHLTPEDVYACAFAGAVEALSGGVTTLLDWCHVVNTPEHAEANLQALRDAGIRARFLYGASMTRKLAEYGGDVEHSDDWSHAQRLHEREFSSDGLIRFGLALQGPDTSTMELTRDDVEFARRLEVPMGFHIGVPQGPEPRHSVARLAAAGLLGSDMNFAHCCATTDEELRLLYEAGATATACPSIDLAMGMGVPAHGRLRDAGLRPSVGADSVIASTGDLFAEMRLALFCERSRRARAVIESGREVDDVGQLGFTTREALESVTANAAHAIWLEEEVGSLRPGKKADIVLLRASDLNLAPASDLVATIVGSANAGNVDTVYVGGRKVKAAGALIGIDAVQVARTLAATRDRMFGYAGYSGMRPDHGRA